MATKARQTQLIPVSELAPGAVSSIRDNIIARVVATAAAELGRPVSDMVVRDIRPYDDLKWATNTDAVAAALTTNTWICESDDSENYNAFKNSVSDTSLANVMSDSRWIAIFGVKDLRMCLATSIARALTFMRISVGGNDRVIWDLSVIQSYPDAMAAICPSGVIIPQNTEYMIDFYGGLSDDGGSTNVASYIMVEGIVVEPRGKVLSP